MNNGIKSRLIIHEILKEIKLDSKNFDDIFFNYIKINNIKKENIKFIHNVVLTTLRYNIIIEKIIEKLVKKINHENDAYILLLSSACQILFMKIKDHAVVYSAVEISKNNKYNISSSFINGTLRNLIRKKEELNKFKIYFKDLPQWFIKNTQNFNAKNKAILIDNIIDQPSLHIVCKSIKITNKYLKFGKKTSNYSISIDKKYNFSEIPNFEKGEWWVQDFSSMTPINLLDITVFNKIADVGSAPGGKLFQLLSKNSKANIFSYEKNKNRLITLNNNLKRLNYKININCEDFLNIDYNNKFDLIILDAPCSSIGTIRRHPEIFFKKKIPDLKSLTEIQSRLLNKCSKNLNKNGIIIYMVCSFLEKETTKQIDCFLNKNSNFTKRKFNYKKNSNVKNLFNKKNDFLCIPKKIMKNVKIDGYFASMIIKNDD